MKIDAINQSQALNGAQQRSVLSFSDAEEWSKSLMEGQVLKGRVMRQFGEHKFSIMFGGKERIVDSAFPLKVGESIKGRIEDISGGLVSMRLLSHQSEAVQESLLDSVNHQSDVFQPFKLSADLSNSLTIQNRLLEAIAGGSVLDSKELVTLTSLFLAKLGLPAEKFLTEFLARQLLASGGTSAARSAKYQPELIFSNDNAGFEEHDIEVVADTLATIYDQDFKQPSELSAQYGQNWLIEFEQLIKKDQTEAFDLDGGDERDNEQKRAFLSYILNTQSDGAAQHRWQILPIMINGKTVEFDVAFFGHSKEKGAEKLEVQSLKFELNTDFGKVFLHLTTLNERVSLSVKASDPDMLHQLQAYHAIFESSVKDAGWILERANYDSGADNESAKLAIIKHVLDQKSLNLSI